MYFYLRNNKTKTKSLIIIRYHIGKGKDRFVYSTGENIHPKDWDKTLKNVKKEKRGVEYAALRKRLNQYSQYLDTLIATYKLNDIDITKELLKKDFDIQFKKIKRAKKSVIACFEDMIQERKSRNYAESTIKKLTTIKNNLIRYEKEHLKRSLVFDDFKGDFFRRWVVFCYEVLDLSDNTIDRQGGYFKTFLRETYKKRLHDISDYTHFFSLKKETDNISLSKKEVLEILHFDFNNKSEQRVIDLFLIGCLTGQRFSDYSVFDKLDYNNGRIEKRAKKTNFKTIIPVDDNIYLKNLLEKYDWQLPKISNKYFNDTLRQALRKIKSFDTEHKKTRYQGSKISTKIIKKWKMCSSHTARRTFISVCLEDGWTYKEVMTISGIRKVETLMKYDKISYKRLGNKVKKTWN